MSLRRWMQRFQSMMQGAGAAAFSPTDVPGLLAWYSSESDLYEEVAKTTPATDDADPVRAQDDQSGNSNDVTQSGIAALVPTLKLNIVNGKQIIRYDGVDDRLELGAKIFSASTPTFSIFISGKPNASTASTLMAYLGQQFPNVEYFGDGSNLRLELQYQVSTTTIVARGSTDIQQQFYVHTLIHGATEDILRINGVAETVSYRVGAFAAGLDASVNNFDIGRVNAGIARYFKGDIRNILIYSGEISGANLTNIEQFLADDIGNP